MNMNFIATLYTVLFMGSDVMFELIEREEIESYIKQGMKIYKFCYHTRREPIMGEFYTAYCIADSIISARKNARFICRINGYTLDEIERYWNLFDESVIKLKGDEIE